MNDCARLAFGAECKPAAKHKKSFDLTKRSAMRYRVAQICTTLRSRNQTHARWISDELENGFRRERIAALWPAETTKFAVANRLNLVQYGSHNAFGCLFGFQVQNEAKYGDAVGAPIRQAANSNAQSLDGAV